MVELPLTEDDEANVEIGYKVSPSPDDFIVDSRFVFHGRVGGDLEGGVFRRGDAFFAPTGCAASEFAAHAFLNRGDFDMGDDRYDEDLYLEGNPVVFPVYLTFENPAMIDRNALLHIATERGITNEEQLRKFIANFEDSNIEEREVVFNWVKQRGHDGIILLNDLMPEVGGGDWCFQTSYVAFNPEQQVRFALELQKTELVASFGM